MVWIDQPIGTGFSQGTVTAKNENDVAQQFMGFWKNFIDTFAMQGYKVYVTGSSYSGMYCPYIASAMLDANDEQYFNVKGYVCLGHSIYLFQKPEKRAFFNALSIEARFPSDTNFWLSFCS